MLAISLLASLEVNQSFQRPFILLCNSNELAEVQRKKNHHPPCFYQVVLLPKYITLLFLQVAPWDWDNYCENKTKPCVSISECYRCYLSPECGHSFLLWVRLFHRKLFSRTQLFFCNYHILRSPSPTEEFAAKNLCPVLYRKCWQTICSLKEVAIIVFTVSLMQVVMVPCVSRILGPGTCEETVKWTEFVEACVDLNACLSCCSWLLISLFFFFFSL